MAHMAISLISSFKRLTCVIIADCNNFICCFVFYFLACVQFSSNSLKCEKTATSGKERRNHCRAIANRFVVYVCYAEEVARCDNTHDNE